MREKIAYIMSRFPHLPETFILREMVELKRQGWEIALYPLMLQPAPVMHAEAAAWKEEARVLPFVSGAVLAANLRALGAQPGQYAEIWRRVVWETRTAPGMLARSAALLPKAVYAARQMQAEGVRHIHAHYATYPALAAWVIHRLTGIPYSVTVHAHDIFVRQEMLATKLREAAGIVAISRYNRDFLARRVGEWTADKTRVIHCGVEPLRYALHAPSPAGARLEIMQIGSLQAYKGQKYLLDALAQLREMGIPFRCRIIGGGALRGALEEQIARLGLSGQAELCGPLPQEEVARRLPEADCYVQPSVVTPSGKMEGIPVALMEALACQVPCVASAISGIPELIRDGDTGLLVAPEDPNALAEAMSRVYREPLMAQRMAQAGHHLVLEDFDLRANSARLGEVFARSLAGPALESAVQ